MITDERLDEIRRYAESQGWSVPVNHATELLSEIDRLRGELKNLEFRTRTNVSYQSLSQADQPVGQIMSCEVLVPDDVNVEEIADRGSVLMFEVVPIRWKKQDKVNGGEEHVILDAVVTQVSKVL